MKKTNNKGFSLVELIIVIAIMAILAGAIAPALIRYIDKSRRSNDVTACKAIKTAVETALGNESIYEYLTTGNAASDTAAQPYCFVYVKPGEVTGADTEAVEDGVGQDCISFTGAYDGEDKINGKTKDELEKLAQAEIATNIGEKTPKLKFKKAADSTIGEPSGFVAAISGGGSVYVFIAAKGATDADFEVDVDEETSEVSSTKGYMICPNVCDEYQ